MVHQVKEKKTAKSMLHVIALGGCPKHGIGSLVHPMESAEIILKTDKIGRILESKFFKPAVNTSSVYCNHHLSPDEDISQTGMRYNDKRGFAICGYSFEIGKRAEKKLQQEEKE